MNENNEEEKPSDAGFDSLLTFLKTNRGFDFWGYKRFSLERRFRRRMASAKVPDFEAYQEYLQTHPREYEFLFNTIQINITAFFRDKPAWDYLATDVIPRILESSPKEQPLRIWSAGCASGEEPYSAVMLFAEAMGLEECRKRLKVYATDVDEFALSQARAAIYEPEKVKAVPLEMLDKYFDVINGRYVIRNDLRRILVFGRHDLMHDAPISRLDLLICRNTLIYFNRDAQKRIIAGFHFGLSDSGYLFLGKAEMLLTHADMFAPIHAKFRIFNKVLPGRVEYLPEDMDHDGVPTRSERLSDLALLQQAAFDSGILPELVVSAEGVLVMANAQARQVFSLEVQDLGRPFRDLEISFRPLELRSLIQRSHEESHTVIVKDVHQPLSDGSIQHHDVQVIPLMNGSGRWMGTHIIFRNINDVRRLEIELEQSRRDVDSANQEQQSTNEELETSNEELQSTVEELQTTNEELQSTNEEMETVNEELQSTNAELVTSNDELNERKTEADKVNSFLSSILNGLTVGVVFVDREYSVLVWNHAAEEMWGLRSQEVLGHSLMDLDIGLPVAELQDPINQLWDDKTDSPASNLGPLHLEAVNRRGKPIRVRVILNKQVNLGLVPMGIVLLMEPEAI